MKFLIVSLICALTLPALANVDPQALELVNGKSQQVRFTLGLDGKPVRFEIAGSNASEKNRQSVLELIPDKNGLAVSVLERESESAKKVVKTQELTYWPPEKSRALRGVEGISPRTWRGRSIPGLIRWDGSQLRIWLEGRLLFNRPLPGAEARKLTVAGGDFDFSPVDETPAKPGFEKADLAGLLKERRAAKTVEVDGIPFEVWEGSAVSLAKAGWPEQSTDPSAFNEAYDGGTYFIGDERLPLFQIPKADYVAAYLLGSADSDPETTDHVTLRMGRRIGGPRVNSQVLIKDFGAEVPQERSVVRIPLTEAFAQDVEGEVMDVELTKEIRLARRTPDPNRFRWRPLGPASGVTVEAVTFELSPIQMNIKATEAGALFELPARAQFEVALENITDQPLTYVVGLKAGETKAEPLEGTIPAKETVTKSLTLPELAPGHYPVTVTLSTKPDETPLLVRHTNLGILPADTRQYRAEAPWGTWDHDGGHFSPDSPEWVGEIMHRLGLRYGMFNADANDRKKFGIIKGNHFKIGAGFKDPLGASGAYEAAKEKHPDIMPEVLIFHEDSISGGHASRIPDIFHDRPPYQLNEEEAQRFDEMMQLAKTSAEALRKDHPEVKIFIGNGPIPLREEMLRAKFPAELFDALGNENPTFSRLPESQPPDPIANNSSLWMDRQLLSAYGYNDKDVTQAHETIYPASNPGNLSYQTQADYFVRNILHSMAWEMPKIRPGSIADAGNSYYHSNWGGTGYMHRRPDLSPKPAALAIATLTSVLDGAKYDGFVDTGSESAYLMRFKKRDGTTVLPFWVVRGERDFSVTIEGADKVRVINQNGAERSLGVESGKVELQATASPGWLELPKGAKVTAVSLGTPSYPNSDPSGKVSRVGSLATLDGWRVGKTKNALLEYYNPMAPRRLGDFAFEPVGEFEGKPAMKVTPKPLATGKETMPMYVELIQDKAIPLPGKPTEIGVWINGNSAWGRVIFELEDASGQRWTSVGSKARSGSVWMADWLGDELAANYTPGDVADWNTDDAWGVSRINFDGWRYVGFPLPGQYPGEGHTWPANSQWNWNKDGVVHYPLALKKVIIELPEKTLYLTDYKPARRPEIYLGEVVSVEGNVDAPKTAVGDYVEAVQITID